MFRSLLLIFALTAPILASYHAYEDCPGSVNSQQVIDQEPRLVQEVTNGKKFIIESTQNKTKLTVLALKGSWYDIGYAYGQLLKDEINLAIPSMFKYLIDNKDTWLPGLSDVLPQEIRWMLNLPVNTSTLLDLLLAAQYEFTEYFTPARYDDQFRGMADGSGFSIQTLIFANMFPELCQAHCSMAGIWGPASADGKLIQLRALDWDYRHVIANYPLAVMYFPTETGSNPFSTFSFVGIIGAISGYSNKVGISEKVWSPSSTELRAKYGEPFLYIMRDVLQFGNDLKSSIDMLFNKPRTCRVHIGVGSSKDNTFEGVQMSYNQMNIFNDKNYTAYTKFHPQIDGIMFWEKHEPANNMCFASVLQQNHGKINAETIYREAVPLHQTGDTQVAVYDFERQAVYLAYSHPDSLTKAFVRPLIKLNMKNLLNYNYFWSK